MMGYVEEKLRKEMGNLSVYALLSGFLYTFQSVLPHIPFCLDMKPPAFWEREKGRGSI